MIAHFRIPIFACAFICLVSLLVSIRPALIDFTRWQGFYAAFHYPFNPDFGREGEPPLLSVSSFADRVRETMAKPDDKNRYYRIDESRSAVDTEHEISTKLHIGYRFDNLNVAMHTASKSTPAIDETGVYVGADTGWFYAFDLNGHLRWRFHAARPERGIHGTAVLTPTKVCFGSYGGAFYCLRKTNGDVIWTMAMPTSSYGSSPLVVDHDLIMGFETGWPINGLIARVHLDDGKLIWESGWLGEQVHSSPVYDRARKQAYFGANNSLVRAIDTEKGEFIWSQNVFGPVKGTPLIAKDGVFVTSWAKTLTKLNPDNGKQIWITSLGSASRSSPTLIPDSNTIVVGSRRAIFGIDATSGKILWQRGVDFEVASSAVAIREPITKKWLAWIACGSHDLCAFDAEGHEAATIGLPGRLTGLVTAFGSSLYLALDFPGGLVRLDP